MFWLFPSLHDCPLSIAQSSYFGFLIMHQLVDFGLKAYHRWCLCSCSFIHGKQEGYKNPMMLKRAIDVCCIWQAFGLISAKKCVTLTGSPKELHCRFCRSGRTPVLKIGGRKFTLQLVVVSFASFNVSRYLTVRRILIISLHQIEFKRIRLSTKP